jgi:transcriptional regulator with XRE-family HTH domain
VEADRVLRAIRRVRWLTQRELASVTGVSRTTIERIEAGRRLPAHLPWFPVTKWDYEHWWGWYRYVPGTGQSQLMPLPPATYRRRNGYWFPRPAEAPDDP